MPLVFLPRIETLFLWDPPPGLCGVVDLEEGGVAAAVELVLPRESGRRTAGSGGLERVVGLELPLFTAVAKLAVVPAAAVESLPGSVACWALASKLALELVARERVVPAIVRRGGTIEARWAAALGAAEDVERLQALAQSLPPAAHAVPVDSIDSTDPTDRDAADSRGPRDPGKAAGAGEAPEVWAPEALLRAFLDAVVDALVRGSRGGPELPGVARAARGRGGTRAKANAEPRGEWEERWRAALASGQRSFEGHGFRERTLVDELGRWSEPALGARDRLRACFRLELPERDPDGFLLRFLLQSPDDPSLLVDAAQVWRTRGRGLTALGQHFVDPQESLLEALGRAARLFEPIGRSLADACPELLALTPAEAFTFLRDGAPLLAQAGFGVLVPGELTAAGERRLRLRMRVGSGTRVAGVVAGVAGLGLDELLSVTWEAVLGDTALSARELEALAAQKAPLVRHRGQWVVVDPAELAEIERRMRRGPRRIAAREALEAVLAGEWRDGELVAAVAATGAFAERIDALRAGAERDVAPPRGLHATLRPYQTRGLGWLSTMASLGLGACLADDMGLGKTIQVLAFLLRRLEEAPGDERPALLVAPTSVLGNWEREAARFAPGLAVVAHHGPGRARSADELPRGAGTVVLTSYGLLRREAELFAGVSWSVVVLDEAQNIKNAASRTARAARALEASHRFALTGTPVENRLAELWSILEFACPGLLGPLDRFRREIAVPVERYGNVAQAERLRKVVGPFLLRRLKSDPAVIRDLPPKNEMKVVCSLSREQATLYRAVVDEEMRRIESADGMERRGRVLALLTFLKQICNHPAQYLGESGPLEHRSGKLARLTEMLEEALAAGDKALVFTQYREMGERLVAHLERTFGGEVPFLQGSTAKRRRDELVRRFQDDDDPSGPRIFVLSLKAGGTGLNLTAASHVFHFDRWWNPAVEDQATDRAYRIGQTRTVQVHKLLSAGTVEEKVDRLLEQKRTLASQVVGSEERWITDLEDGELSELVALSGDVVVEDDERDDLDGGAPAPGAPGSGTGVRRPRARRASTERVDARRAAARRAGARASS